MYNLTVMFGSFDSIMFKIEQKRNDKTKLLYLSDGYDNNKQGHERLLNELNEVINEWKLTYKNTDFIEWFKKGHKSEYQKIYKEVIELVIKKRII